MNRRKFRYNGSISLVGTSLVPTVASAKLMHSKKDNPIFAHLWVYASKFPLEWDATPVLENIFSDLSYAGIEGLELMERVLRHDDAVKRLNKLVKKYDVPVSGYSYSGPFKMWDIEQHNDILEDVNLVLPRLAKVGGKTLGISVGGKNGLKTEAELDAQAELLKKIRSICDDHGILPNLHNHNSEVENNMHDLKGILARIPDFPLGPDLNWLIRGGVDPVEFIQAYSDQIVYLHIRDQYEDGTWTEYVGQGDTAFEPIAAALKAKNYNGPLAIELAFPNDFTPEYELKETWKKSREFVEKVFGIL